MDWTALAGLPVTLLSIAAGIALLLGVFQLLAMRQRLREARPLRAGGHGLGLLLAIGLTTVFACAALTLRGYRLLDEDAPVVDIRARILSPQRWALTLQWPDGSSRQLALWGDAFRVEAVVLKWRLPALLAGLPPLYRLDRLSGRYDDTQQEMQAPRTVIGFVPAGDFDLLDLHRQYPRMLPWVDSVFGSGAYLPLIDQGHYTISLMRSGALVAGPDEATLQRIGQPLGD
ncbi:MAG: hypothetical protein ABW154_13630 [Dyella sp.]